MEMIERSETANVLDAEANQHMEETRIRKCIVIHDASIELEGKSKEMTQSQKMATRKKTLDWLMKG